MRIAITGTRGIPNHYGGFEQFAEYLSIGLVRLKHEVWVYNPHFHSYKEESYKGVEIVRKRFPEKLMGPAGNYLYDLACIRDALKRDADIILECGYASAAPWYPFLKFGKTRLITHMDGMERQREKWGAMVKKLFLQAEKMAVSHSDALVCDHPEIARYYQENYSLEPAMISYGAEVGQNWDPGVPADYQLNPGEYYLLVARLEPENNIRMIIEGFLASQAGGKHGTYGKDGTSERIGSSEEHGISENHRTFEKHGTSEVTEVLVIIGKIKDGYGRKIFKEFGRDQRLRFPGGVYDQEKLNNLRHFSKAEFHGHSVGGTNPSLLEAMAAGTAIIAHENVYNRWVLGDNADFFQTAGDIPALLSENSITSKSRGQNAANNLKKIEKEFRWSDVVRQYEKLFRELIED